MTETQEPRAVAALTDVAVHRRTTGQEIVLDGINWELVGNAAAGSAHVTHYTPHAPFVA
ncbi:hypothetical protein [Streptomyces asiaticus]